MEIVEHGGLLINAAFLPLLAAHGLDSFEAIRGFPGGEIITKKAVRSVVRITLDDGGQKRGFFLKRHRSSLWARVKGVLLPAASEDCGNEWNKIVLLTECGFSTATPVAYGERASLSLTLTEEIYDSVRVEDYIPKLAAGEKGFAGAIKKRELIRRIGTFAREFHRLGFHHQDFYLGHFLIRPSTGELFLLDVQRVQKMEELSKRWIIKDLAQIVFSAKNVENFSSADLVRFGYAYLGEGRFDRGDKKVIRTILSKSGRIARHTEKFLDRRKRRAA